MILILSTESDYSTGQVIRWLNHFQQEFIRLNENDEVIIEKLTHDDLLFSLNNEKIFLSDISSIWYRRGDFQINTIPFKIKKTLLKDYNETETKVISSFIHNLFKTKKSINNYNHSDVNKLDILKYCKENDMNNSNFVVTQSKKEESSDTAKFTYTDKGTMATIGRAKAVADIRGIKLSGFFAWFLWSFIHVLSLIGFRNRTRVFIEWVWSYFTYKRGVRLITDRSECTFCTLREEPSKELLNG